MNLKNTDNKTKIIIGLSLIAILAVSFIGFKQIENHYLEKGFNLGQAAVINEELRQLQTNGYIALELDGQILYLGVLEKNV